MSWELKYERNTNLSGYNWYMDPTTGLHITKIGNFHLNAGFLSGDKSKA
jgi:hypothetical protein